MMDQLWQTNVNGTRCIDCDYLFFDTASHALCPRCCTGTLATADQIPTAESVPEQMIPHSVAADDLRTALTQFVKSVRYRPDGLNVDAMMACLQRVYVPFWTVTSDIDARWQTKMGFDYNVVSHVERYSGGSWRTDQVQNVKTDWYPRAGHSTLQYRQLQTPAIRNHSKLVGAIGKFNNAHTVDYAGGGLGDVLIRVPTRPQSESWPDVEKEIWKRTQRDAIKAGGGDRVDEFTWEATFPNQTWNYLLMPLFTTYYHDAENEVVPVVVHGQTAAVNGTRRGSMAKARRAATIIGVVGIIALLAALGMWLAQITYFVAPIVLGVILLIVALMQVWSVKKMNEEPLELIW